MKVLIASVDFDKTHLIRRKTISYEGLFKSNICSGNVYFVPYDKDPNTLKPGKYISVETDIESVEGLEILPHVSEPKMIALEKPFSYEMIGKVVQNSDNTVFDIDIDDLPIAIDIEETNGVVLEKGNWIKFIVHGLSLWDENIY